MAPLCRRLAAALGVAVSGVAVAQIDMDRLQELVRDDRMEAAYELASEHLNEHAGELRFDFLYGIAAIDTGHVGEGVFALERVLMREPALDRARLEYARGLFLLGDDRAARAQFERVLARDPPPPVVARVERYLAAMDRRADRYRTTVTGDVGVRVGADDNVNRAPDAASIDLGFGTLRLAEDSQAARDGFLAADGRVDVSRPLYPGLNAVAGARADVRRHGDEEAFDTSLAGAELGLRWRAGAHRLAGMVDFRRLYVDGEGYQSATGVNGSYQYRLGDRLTAHAQAGVTALRYDEQEILDSRIAVLGAGASRSFDAAWHPHVRVTVLVGREDAREDTEQARALAERDIVELRGRVGVAPLADWTVSASARVRDSEYGAVSPLFGEAREETYASVDLALTWRPDAHWRLGPYVRHARNDANVALYDYERTVVGVEARYGFF